MCVQKYNNINNIPIVYSHTYRVYKISINMIRLVLGYILNFYDIKYY